MPFIHVAERHEITAASRRIVRIAIAFAFDANTGDIDSVIGAENFADKRKRNGSSPEGAGMNKLAAGDPARARFGQSRSRGCFCHGAHYATIQSCTSITLALPQSSPKPERCRRAFMQSRDDAEAQGKEAAMTC